MGGLRPGGARPIKKKKQNGRRKSLDNSAILDRTIVNKRKPRKKKKKRDIMIFDDDNNNDDEKSTFNYTFNQSLIAPQSNIDYETDIEDEPIGTPYDNPLQFVPIAPIKVQENKNDESEDDDDDDENIGTPFEGPLKFLPVVDGDNIDENNMRKFKFDETVSMGINMNATQIMSDTEDDDKIGTPYDDPLKFIPVIKAGGTTNGFDIIRDIENLQSETNLDLVVYGYIRQMTENVNNVIPLNINQICLKYYKQGIKTQLFAIYGVKSSKKKRRYSMGDVIYSNKFVYIDIINKKIDEMKGLKKLLKEIHQITFMDTFKLSSKAIKYFLSLKQDKNKNFELNEDKEYSAMIANTIYGKQKIIFYPNVPQKKKKNEDNNDILRLYGFNLPEMTENTRNNVSIIPTKIDDGIDDMVYSKYYGLISFNYFYKQFDRLKFNDNSSFKWKKLFKIDTKNFDDNNVYNTAKQLCLIPSYSSINDKLLTFQYYVKRREYPYKSSKHCIKLYSLKNGKHKDIAQLPEGYAREKFATYYDIITENLYLMGGDNGCSRAVNTYDFHKNVWYNTATMQFEHGSYPVIWMNGFILYIAGGCEGRIGTVECFDTRYDKSHWILANKDLQLDQILPPCNFRRLFKRNVL